MTAKAGGEAEFEIECTESGAYTNTSLCMPVSCGTPEAIPHCQMPIQEFTFKQQFSAVCETGYSLDAKADGETTFSGICGKEGTFEGLKTCEPVSCGAPQGT